MNEEKKPGEIAAQGSIELVETSESPPHPRLTTTLNWWWVLFAIAGAIFLGLGSLYLLRIFARPIALFLFGVVIAAALQPIVEWLNRWLSNVVSIVLVYLVIVLILIGLGFVVIPPLVQQGQQLVDRTPQFIDQVSNLFSRFGQQNNLSITNALTSNLGNLGSFLISLPVTVVSSIFELILVLFVSIYFLIDLPGMNRFVCSLFPEGERDPVARQIAKMGSAMGGYIRGTVINGIIVGAFTYAGMLVIGVNYPIVIGVIAGLMELIPVVGPVITAVIAVALALFQSPGLALWVLVFFVVLQQAENHLLVPNIMRSQTDITPLLAVVALFAGGFVGGLLGALVAIPVAAALKVFIQDVIAPVVRKRTKADQPVVEQKTELAKDYMS